MSANFFDVNNALSLHEETLTLRVNEDTEVYTRENDIGKGGNGVVTMYRGAEGVVAVKRVLRTDPELAVVELLEQGRVCNVVRARRITCKTCTSSAYIAMELMDGDLYRRRYDQAAVIRIVRQLRQQLHCLANIREERPLLYTDLKASNILFRDGGTGGVRLGDLGSAGMHSDDKYITTYPFLQRTREWPRTNSLPVDTFHRVPLDQARDCVAYQLAGVALDLVSGQTIQIRGSDHWYTLVDVSMAQALRTEYARLLRQYFPWEPYGDWLSLDPAALEEFWTAEQPVTARTTASDVAASFEGRYSAWPVVAAVWCATQYASDADLLTYTTGVLDVLPALYVHTTWYDASYHVDKGFLPEIHPDDTVNTDTVVTEDLRRFIMEAIVDAAHANDGAPFDWTYFIAHHLQLHAGADVSSMLAVFPPAILQRVQSLCKQNVRQLVSPAPYRAVA
jgi:serine/threonine protein kinase